MLISLQVGIHSQKPVVVAAISQGYVNYIRDLAIPIINKEFHTIHVPDQSGKAGPIHYELENIYFNVNQLTSSQIAVNLINGQSEIQLSVNNIGGNGNLDAHYKILFVKGHSRVTVGMQDVGSNVKLFFGVDGSGRPRVSANGDLDIQYKHFSLHFSGSVSSVVLDILEPIIKDILIHEIRNNFNTILSTITDNVNKKLAQIPLDHQIKDPFYVHYSFPYAPVVVNDHISIPLYAYIYPRTHPSPPPFYPPALPSYDPNNKKGVQIFLSDFFFQTGLDAVYEISLFKFSYNITFLKIYMELDCYLSQAPKIALAGNFFFNASARCDVKAIVNDTTEKFGIISNVIFDVSEVIKNSIMYFRIDEKNIGLENLQFVNPSQFNLTWIEDNIDFFVATIATVVNDFFGNTGFPLPKIANITYTDIEEYIRTNYIALYTTPQIHFNP